MLKIASATAEEYIFAQDCNRALAGAGASVHPFCMVEHHDDGHETRSYRLTMQCGGKRSTLQADSPFHYDPPDDVVRRVKEWIAGACHSGRWTTDLEKADGE
jgi:hypothetical protein